ncbi:hypothetical protein XENOCAPTIV_023743 [Xenoophorus captivus]|uniref:Uncharacterized protein n=1 Tax=Xenoophorus captivus TaxID=1517983 RepID=A0ABV0QE82_9TELE
MRALRDFNIPKIVTEDMPVFMGLIGDLFPSLEVPRRRDLDFEKHVKQAILDLKLQPEDNFILKVVQLEELLEVRHSVFVIGNAGTGKSQVMRSLHRTYQNMKRRPMWADLNPKAVTNDELFGIINPATREFKKIIPIPEQSVVQMLCYVLECLLTPENTPPDSSKDLYELYFVFAAIWAFGGALFQDQACLVHTTETVRVRYFMDRLLECRRPVMLVGNAGTGKSVLVGDKLGSLDAEKYMVKNVPFNYYTTSAMLQGVHCLLCVIHFDKPQKVKPEDKKKRAFCKVLISHADVLEKPLEKKAGRNYGPPGSRRLIYFIDDMNMPEVDAYGTVQPHTLIRQHMDYNHW